MSDRSTPPHALPHLPAAKVALQLPPGTSGFVGERHLATLTTLRPDGTPHVVPVGFTLDIEEGLVRIITTGGSRKVRNITDAPSGVAPRAVVCQVDGGRWLSLEGVATVSTDPSRVATAVRRYAERYREPRPNDSRVVIEITVDRVLGRATTSSGPPNPA